MDIKQKNNNLSDALAVIYDPIRGNMLTSRSVLHGMGFRRIDGITTISALDRKLKDNEIAILFIDASEESDKIVELLQSIRMTESNANPFLPIVVTLWVGNGDLVANLMNAGADDVLLRPFSVNRLQDRVKVLIESRKKFVVTSDYVGPDRGKAKQGTLTIDAFDVPNPLKKATLGEEGDPIEYLEAMEKAKKRINKERIAKLARRIAMAAEVTIQANGKNNDDRGFVIDLLETAAELVKTAKRMGTDDVQDIASVLENVVGKTASDPANRAENAQLTRQLAFAIYANYAVEEGEEFKKELDMTLDLVRARLLKAKERVSRLQELNHTVANFNNSEISDADSEAADLAKKWISNVVF